MMIKQAYIRGGEEKLKTKIFFQIGAILWAAAPLSFLLPGGFIYMPLVAAIYTYWRLDKLIPKIKDPLENYDIKNI